jgi:predicted transcriptional regulator
MEMTNREMYEADFVKYLIDKHKDIAKWTKPFFGKFNNIENPKEIIKSYLNTGIIKKAEPGIVLEALKMIDLKAILKNYNLPSKGNKKDLIDRICHHVPNILNQDFYPNVFELTEDGENFYKNYYKYLSIIVMGLYKMLLDGEFVQAKKECSKYTSGKREIDNSYTISSDSYIKEFDNAVQVYLVDSNIPATPSEKLIYFLMLYLPSRFFKPISEFAEAMQIPHENFHWNQKYIQSILNINRINNCSAKFYIIHTAQDCRVCRNCEQISEAIFPISEIKIGINYPPLHKDCRCFAEPIIVWDEIEWPHRVYADGKIEVMTKEQFVKKFMRKN